MMGDMAELYDYAMDDDDYEVLRRNRKSRQHDPKCAGHNVKRTNRATGEPFWGCSVFPQCRWTKPMTTQEAVGEVPNDAWEAP